MNQIDLSIIIVNYNTPNIVYDCLQSIAKWLKVDHEVIIVNNGKDEEKKVSEDKVKSILKNSPFSIINIENAGFGNANNEGAKKANGKYLFLLNPDTILVDDSVDKMFEFISRHKEIGALTCLLYNDLNCKIMQKAFFGKFQSLGSLTIRRYNYQKLDLTKEFFYTDIITGAAFMISKDIYDRTKGFDENIFMYLEDDDLCKRIVDMGYKNAVMNSAKIVHLEGKSTNDKEKKRYYYKSQDYYWRKHNGLVATVLMKILRFPIKFIKTSK